MTMFSFTTVTIPTHTTSSFPRPHIVYNLHITNMKNGDTKVVGKRYSDFIALDTALNSPAPLPPKRIIVTTFIPSAWMDNALINERRVGLTNYLTTVLKNPAFEGNPVLHEFLFSSSPRSSMRQLHLEDAVPSTLSRSTAVALVSDLRNGNVVADGGNEEKANASGPIAAGYYPDWVSGDSPPENVDFSKFDILFFAFAVPDERGNLTLSSDILRRLVSSARNSGNGTQIVLSVGGWGGSAGFSSASNSQNRATFVQSLVGAVQQYGLDGIDIDWEYPNSTGAGNPHSPDDAANLLKVFTALRSALGNDKIISSAVPHLPWIGSNGQPLTDISAYADQMTYINIMNYDVWGASSNPGPNAPLNNGCGNSSQPQASAEAAFNQWTAAGAPASKLLLGLPLYGYVSQSSNTVLRGFAPTEKETIKANPACVHAHPRKKTTPTPTVTTAEGEVQTEADTNLTGWYGQQIPFKTLVSSGALVKGDDGNYRQGGGFTMGWDDCSDTPYLFKQSQQTVVTYDDTWSLSDKAVFAKNQGMAGCFTWSIDQDDGYTLQNVIRASLGK
ncbi:glycoside hydrolase family 18 protein [Marasmius fiardii PR-910]|nr:glycoside hydrolase family 18 protein [Marasmius fiardii PR-910]